MTTRTATQKTVEAAIRDYIAKNILFIEGAPDFDDDDSFLENGIVDSTGILELQLFVEEAFGIKVLEEDLLPENFDSICKLASYVQTKRAHSR